MKMVTQAFSGLRQALRAAFKPGKPPIRTSILKTPFYY